VNGRLSTAGDGRPIPLMSVRLQYHRFGESDIVRDVSVVTSNPSGLFQDLVNTTYLLRIGQWVVDASFQSQLGYESTSATKNFTIVVQPDISLYVTTHQLSLGQQVEFNGLLFACIPCINDHVMVALFRPDNSTINVPLVLNATGGPYPGGYYDGRFTPDTPGQWHVRAIWAGNDVMLPAYSQFETFNVESPSILPGISQSQFYSAGAVVALGAIASVVILLLSRRRERSQ
jgi:hypothetical protein